MVVVNLWVEKGRRGHGFLVFLQEVMSWGDLLKSISPNNAENINKNVRFKIATGNVAKEIRLNPGFYEIGYYCDCAVGPLQTYVWNRSKQDVLRILQTGISPSGLQMPYYDTVFDKEGEIVNFVDYEIGLVHSPYKVEEFFSLCG